MYSRSIVERIKIQIEILFENIADFIRRNSLRTPMLILSMLAVIVTLKNARATVDAIKQMSGSPFKAKKSVGRSPGGGGHMSSYQQPPRANYAAPYSQPAPHGAPNQFGSQGSHMNSQFGQQSQFGSMSSPMNQGAPSFNNGNLRGTSATMPGSFGAGAGTSGQSVPPGLFHSFTAMPGFSGQIDTLSAPDAPGFVDQALRQPGAGRVLVVDGGGSMNGIFDSSMAMVAQQNGWKGVIINGYVIDPQAIQGLPFGVQALGSNPVRGMQMMGQRGIPLTIGGVLFNPGSMVTVSPVSPIKLLINCLHFLSILTK